MTCIPAGGIMIGVVSDCLNARAMSCVVMLFLAVPSVSFLNFCQFAISNVNDEYLSGSVISVLSTW